MIIRKGRHIFHNVFQHHIPNLLSGLITSMVGGVVVAVLVVPGLDGLWIVLSSFLLLIFTILIIAALVISSASRDRVLLITYIDPSIPFLSDFISRCIVKFGTINKSLDIIYVPGTQNLRRLPGQVEKALSRLSPYYGVILIPNYWQPVSKEFIDRYRGINKPLLVVEDVTERKNDLSDIVGSQFGFVYHSNVEGAEMAAAEAIKVSRKLQERASIVKYLIIGFNGPAIRHEVFFEKIKESDSNCEVRKISINLGESLQMRHDVSNSCKNNEIDEFMKEGFTIVFCANDDLALGFISYTEFSELDWDKIRVISYDGTLPIKTLVDLKRSPVCLTMFQDTDLLSEECRDWMQSVYEGRSKHNFIALQAKMHPSSAYEESLNSNGAKSLYKVTSA